jgi:hypothetical protein
VSKKYEEELCFDVIQVHLLEHQRKHNDGQSVRTYVYPNIRHSFIIHNLQNTWASYNRQLKQVIQRYVSVDGDRGHLIIGNFHSGILLLFSFHEPLMNLEISKKYNFATDMSIQTS